MTGAPSQPVVSRCGRQRQFLYGGVGLGFLALWFFYVWLRVQPAIEQFHSGPVLFLTSSALAQSCWVPGGALECGASVLAQFNRFNWLGALISAGLGGLVIVTVRQVVAGLSGDDPPLGACFIPAFFCCC